MSVKKLPLPPAPAKRGTKVGWKVLGGEVPPESYEEFHQVALQEGVTRSELMRRIVTDFLDERKAA